jgi:hypothetical protein
MSVAVARFFDRRMERLYCSGCEESQPLFSYGNAEALVLRVITFHEQHSRCLKFKNPARARAALRWERIIKEMGAPRAQRVLSNPDWYGQYFSETDPAKKK